MRRVFVICLLLIAAFAGGPTTTSAEWNATGDDVKVGVIDFGFDITDGSPIEENVEKVEVFSGSGNAQFTDTDAHGTTVSEIVTDPDIGGASNAELYIASGDGASIGYYEAIDWLVQEQDVDIIVASLGFYNVLYDGDSEPARAAADAVENGTVFITSSGNQGQKHWRGNLTGSGEYLEISGETHNEIVGANADRIYITRTDRDNESYPSNLQMELRYPDSTTDTLDLNLSENEIFRTESPSKSTIPDGTEIRFTGDPAPIDMHIRGAGAQLQISRQIGALTSPADAPETISVGAINNQGQIQPYSSGGPNVDGEAYVDFVATDDHVLESRSGTAGTSFAAPVVTGYTAQLLEQDPSLTPQETQDILSQSTEQSQQDPVLGYGTIDTSVFSELGPFNITGVERTSAGFEVVAENDGQIRSVENLTARIDGELVYNSEVTLQPGQQRGFYIENEWTKFGNRSVQIENQEFDVTLRPQSGVEVSHTDTVRYRINSYSSENRTAGGGLIANVSVTESQGQWEMIFTNLEPRAEHIISVGDESEVWQSTQNGTITVTGDEATNVSLTRQPFGFAAPDGIEGIASLFDSQSLENVPVGPVIVILGLGGGLVVVYVRSRGVEVTEYV